MQIYTAVLLDGVPAAAGDFNTRNLNPTIEAQCRKALERLNDGELTAPVQLPKYPQMTFSQSAPVWVDDEVLSGADVLFASTDGPVWIAAVLIRKGEVPYKAIKALYSKLATGDETGSGHYKMMLEMLDTHAPALLVMILPYSGWPGSWETAVNACIAMAGIKFEEQSVMQIAA